MQRALRVTRVRTRKCFSFITCGWASHPEGHPSLDNVSVYNTTKYKP